MVTQPFISVKYGVNVPNLTTWAAIGEDRAIRTAPVGRTKPPVLFRGNQWFRHHGNALLRELQLFFLLGR
jgi:hypothetical protein